MYTHANLHTHILINYANKETEIPFYSSYKKMILQTLSYKEHAVKQLLFN